MGADSGSDKMFRAEFSSLVNSFKWTTCKLHDGIIQACKCLCYKEEQNLTPCWIFSFTLTFASHCFCSKNTKRILCIHNDLFLGNLPLCLNVTPKCLWSGLCSPVDGYRKKEINTSPHQHQSFQERFVRITAIFTLPLQLPCLFYKRIWYANLNKMVILRH